VERESKISSKNKTSLYFNFREKFGNIPLSKQKFVFPPAASGNKNIQSASSIDWGYGFQPSPLSSRICYFCDIYMYCKWFFFELKAYMGSFDLANDFLHYFMALVFEWLPVVMGNWVFSYI